MELQATLYLTEPSSVNDFLREPDDEARLRRCHVYFGPHDMSDMWTKVGTCTVEADFGDLSTARQEAVGSIELQIDAVKKDFTQKINMLQGMKAELSCLEAPKDTGYREGVYGDGEYM